MNVFRRRIKSPSSSQEVPSSALSNPWRIPICQMRKPRHESVSASWDLHPGLQEASQVALVLKNLPCQCRRSLAQEDPLEEGMATHSSILVWKIPWTEEPGGLQSRGLQRVGYDLACMHCRRSTHCKTSPETQDASPGLDITDETTKTHPQSASQCFSLRETFSLLSASVCSSAEWGYISDHTPTVPPRTLPQSQLHQRGPDGGTAVTSTQQPEEKVTDLDPTMNTEGQSGGSSDPPPTLPGARPG